MPHAASGVKWDHATFATPWNGNFSAPRHHAALLVRGAGARGDDVALEIWANSSKRIIFFSAASRASLAADGIS